MTDSENDTRYHPEQIYQEFIALSIQMELREPDITTIAELRQTLQDQIKHRGGPKGVFERLDDWIGRYLSDHSRFGNQFDHAWSLYILLRRENLMKIALVHDYLREYGGAGTDGGGDAMAVEVDQSGKIEQLDTATVVACANDVSSAVGIKVSEKRMLFLRLRHSIIPKKDRLAVIFAVMVFLLLRTLKKLPLVIVVDEEYTGKDRLVCETLEKLLLRHTKGKWRGVIRIGRVGKHSPAHLLAWTGHKKGKTRKDSIKVTAADIMGWWQ